MKYSTGKKNSFHNTTYGKLDEDEVILQIKAFLETDPSASYSVIVGTDSHEKSHGSRSSHTIQLVTAVVVHRKGFGGRYFWQQRSMGNIRTLRDKIYAETMQSLSFATEFIPKLRRALNGQSPSYDLEIHIDVGEHGDTREMIKEVVGMVTGNGFVAKTKPEAYGASYVADKHT